MELKKEKISFYIPGTYEKRTELLGINEIEFELLKNEYQQIDHQVYEIYGLRTLTIKLKNGKILEIRRQEWTEHENGKAYDMVDKYYSCSVANVKEYKEIIK